MSTQTIQNDEDLIILWDDTSKDTSFLDFNFDVNQSSVTNTTTTDTLISFWEDIKDTSWDISFWFDSETPSITLEEPKKEEVVSFDTNIDFWFSSEPTSSTSDLSFDVNEEKAEVVNDNSIFDLKSEETPVLQQETENLLTFSRTDILDEAIAKMQSRKSVVATTKTQKQTKIDELNSQVEALKKEIELFESQVVELDKEDAVLDLDIWAIEKMKSVSIDVTAERPRKHNLDTIKKTK